MAGIRTSGRDRIAGLARAVTPPRFLRQYRQRAAFRRRVRRLALTAGGALLAYLFLLSDGGAVSIALRRLEIRRLDQLVRDLEKRDAWLRRELALREDDHDMIERLARERYGMAYPGEKVYRILEVDEDTAQRIEDQRRVLAEHEDAGADSP